jgi:hypothetical protein
MLSPAAGAMQEIATAIDSKRRHNSFRICFFISVSAPFSLCSAPFKRGFLFCKTCGVPFCRRRFAAFNVCRLPLFHK